ncbi:MAG: hypothetical protein EXR72_01340 [Myxococcales bacterium]|nr:hypothetical protein [Myxococcales bacterium]
MRFASAVLAGAILVSSFLLFTVEPMIAKMILPWFGGGPAIWNTCLLFFQALLLCGYAYSHGGSLLGTRTQMALHLVLLLGSLLALPLALSERFLPGPGEWPVLPLLAALGAAIGPPFLVLSANSSLVQRWYALRSGREPYFLYAASNAGSLVALLAYPFVIEPLIGLAWQRRLFTVGYLGFVAITVLAMVAALAGKRSAIPRAAPSASIAWSRRLRWLLLPAVPSLLLLAVSQRITTDLAPVPLLWTVPLGLYLLSFILAFLAWLPYPRAKIEPFAMMFITLAIVPWPWLLAGSLFRELMPPLGALFLGCWICHADLARDRPPPDRLTEFYLWVALGGVLGGLLGSLAAPLVFDDLLEYPLALVLVAVVLALKEDRGAALLGALRRRTSYLAPAAMAAVLAVALLLIRTADADARAVGEMLPLVVLLAGLLAWKRPERFLFACALVGLFAVLGLHHEVRILEARRSFFGVLRVAEGKTQRRLMHGMTEHGVQMIDPPSSTPGSYYHPRTPMGAAVLRQRPGARIAVVGLGTGALAALLSPGQSMTYYEIDPLVEEMARRWFTFLRDSRGTVDVVVGDARLTLKRAPATSSDLLVVDAFSGDAVPLHLLTVEAVALYVARLAPDGVLLVHVSNRYLDLARVLRATARRLGLHAALRRFVPDEALEKQGVAPNTVVALSPAAAPIAALLEDGWSPLGDHPAVEWTDDRSSLLAVFLE